MNPKRVAYFAHVLIVLTSFIHIILTFINFPIDFVNMMTAISGIICFIYYLFFGNNFLKIRAVLLGVAYSIFMLVSLMYNGNARMVNILWIWAYLGTAMLLYEFGLSYKIGMLMFYIPAIFALYKVLLDTSSAAFIELSGSSTNNISTLLIYAMSIYIITIYKKDKNIPIPYLPVIIIALISLIVANRGGLLSCIIFFILILIYNLIVNKESKTKNILTFLVLLAFIVYFFTYKIDSYAQMMENKLDRYGTESPRTLIWKEYISGFLSSPTNFFLGIDTEDTLYPTLKFYNGNTHNSFLMLHAKFGILGFLFIIYSIIKAFIFLLKSKMYPIIFCLIILILRSMFDWTAFPGIYDVLFYYFVFVAFDKYNHIRY